MGDSLPTLEEEEELLGKPACCSLPQLCPTKLYIHRRLMRCSSSEKVNYLGCGPSVFLAFLLMSSWLVAVLLIVN